jgi:protocatechuate 3,4-dioxygenase beta subunit
MADSPAPVRLGATNDVTQTVISADPAEQGERLIVTGAVYAADCVPLADATILVWQTNADGLYGPTQELCCYLGGALTTDANGRYAFETVKPAPYKDESSPPPAHIHYQLQHPDAGEFETEMLFKGDPYLSSGVDPTLVVQLTTEDGPTGPYLRGVFDIVMPRR